MSRKYAAWHKTETGYDTSKEVEDFIKRQDNPDDWHIVCTTDDFVINEEMESEIRDKNERELNNAFNKGKEFQKQKIKSILEL